MTGPVSVIEKLIATLPKTLAVANGDVIVLSPSSAWTDEREKIPRTYPHGTIRQLGRAPVSEASSFGTTETQASDTDTITFVSGTLDYQVENRDIHSIQSVTGTRLGSAYTFVQGTDYEVATSKLYSTPDLVRWKAGGNKPDNGTAFTVTYKHRLYDTLRVADFALTYRLTLHVMDLASGASGATVAYTKDRLGEQLADALAEFLMVNRGKNLFGTGELVLGPAGAFSMAPIDEGESLSRWVVDVRLHRKHVAAAEKGLQVVGKTRPTYTVT